MKFQKEKRNLEHKWAKIEQAETIPVNGTMVFTVCISKYGNYMTQMLR